MPQLGRTVSDMSTTTAAPRTARTFHIAAQGPDVRAIPSAARPVVAVARTVHDAALHAAIRRARTTGSSLHLVVPAHTPPQLSPWALTATVPLAAGWAALSVDPLDQLLRRLRAEGLHVETHPTSGWLPGSLRRHAREVARTIAGELLA